MSLASESYSRSQNEVSCRAPSLKPGVRSQLRVPGWDNGSGPISGALVRITDSKFNCLLLLLPCRRTSKRVGWVESWTVCPRHDLKTLHM